MSDKEIRNSYEDSANGNIRGIATIVGCTTARYG